VTRAVGVDQAGSRFIAINRPGVEVADNRGDGRFRTCRAWIPSIGGRYSVLSDFGLVPAAAMASTIARLLSATDIMVRSLRANVPPVHNPGVCARTVLGCWEGRPRQGHHHRIARALPISARGSNSSWPSRPASRAGGSYRVDAEPPGAHDVYGEDRLFIHVRLSGDADAKQDDAVTALERAGRPVVRITVTDRYHIGQEFFSLGVRDGRCRFILGINPFDQPDVEASKDKTRELTAAYERTGELPSETALLSEAGLALFTDERTARHSGRPGHWQNILAHTSDAFKKETIARSLPMSNATSAIATHFRICGS